MTQAELDTVHARLESSSTVAQNLNVGIGRVSHMLYGVDGRGRFTPEQIAEEKTRVKTDIANLIVELTAINNLIH